MGIYSDMADDIDRADEHIERTLAATIRASSANTVMVKRTGACLNCGTPFDAGDLHLYCDADCRDDHEKLLKLRGK